MVKEYRVMRKNIILAVVSFILVTFLFVKKWGWLTAGIIFLAGLVYLAIGSGALGFLF